MSGKTYTLKEFSERLQAMSAEMRGEAMANALMAGAKVVSNAARQNIKEQDLIRTRTLSRSITEQITEQTAERVVAEVGTNLEYAAIHEFGGTIRAKNTKYLAIPVGSYKGSPSSHSDLKTVFGKNGNVVMVDKSGTAQYVLKPSVTIPAQPYLRPALDENQDKVIETIGQALGKIVEEAL
jgi:HK97 gp10 family phage protein